MLKMSGFSKLALLFLGLLVACPLACWPTPSTRVEGCHESKGVPGENAHFSKPCCANEAILTGAIDFGQPTAYHPQEFVELPSLEQSCAVTFFPQPVNTRDLLFSNSVLRI
jgi:hypothetical protein